MSIQQSTALQSLPFQFAGVNRRGLMAVFAATTAMALGFGGLSLTSVFMRPIEADLGWTRSQTSLAYAFATLGMAAGSVVWGRLSDRLDLRLLLSIGAAGMVMSLLAMASVASLTPFYAASLVYGGLGFSVLYAPLLSTSVEWFPHRRGLVMGVVTAGGALGQGVVPFLASLMIGAFGWRIAMAGIGVAMLALFSLTLPHLGRPEGMKPPAPTPRGPGVHAQRARIMLLAMAAFLCCACMGMPLVHMTNFIAMVCGSPAAGAQSLLIAMVAGAIGRVCFGAVADRMGPLASYAAASAAQTACVFFFSTPENGLSFYLLSAVFGIGSAGNMTCLTLCVRQAVPANQFGGAIGIVMMVAWAGMAGSGYAGGLLFDALSSYALAFTLAGAAGVLNLLLIGVIAATQASSATANVFAASSAAAVAGPQK